jgi:hypothetical protein
MINEHISDGQIVFRCIHYPLGFNKSKLNHSKSLNLRPRDGKLFSSLVWRRLAPSIDMVHAYGCRNSDRRRAAGMQDVYCGFYAFRVGEIRAIRDPQGGTADVAHHVENGEIAHSDLIVTLPGSMEESDLPGFKTKIIDRLWRILRGPEVFTGQNHYVVVDPSSMMEQARVPYVDDRDGFSLVLDWIWYSWAAAASGRWVAEPGTVQAAAQ